MSDYTFSNNFNSLASTFATLTPDVFNTEFGLVQAAVNSKADKANPTFTGTVTMGNLTLTGTLSDATIASPTVTGTASMVDITLSGTLSGGTIDGGTY